MRGCRCCLIGSKENGIDNIGYEDYDAGYDSQMRYIGKGPAGYYELLGEITAVANKLQSSGFIEGKFGRPIPIIIHDLEYPWYIIEATRKANPGGEADTFLAAMQEAWLYGVKNNKSTVLHRNILFKCFFKKQKRNTDG